MNELKSDIRVSSVESFHVNACPQLGKIDLNTVLPDMEDELKEWGIRRSINETFESLTEIEHPLMHDNDEVDELPEQAVPLHGGGAWADDTFNFNDAFDEMEENAIKGGVEGDVDVVVEGDDDDDDEEFDDELKELLGNKDLQKLWQGLDIGDGKGDMGKAFEDAWGQFQDSNEPMMQQPKKRKKKNKGKNKK